MPTANNVDAWQIGRQRQINIEVIEKLAGSTPRFSERRNVLLAQSRFGDEVGGPIREPRIRVPFGNDAAGKLHGGLAARSYFRQVRRSNSVELLVDGRNALAQPIDLR